MPRAILRGKAPQETFFWNSDDVSTPAIPCIAKQILIRTKEELSLKVQRGRIEQFTVVDCSSVVVTENMQNFPLPITCYLVEPSILFFRAT